MPNQETWSGTRPPAQGGLRASLLQRLENLPADLTEGERRKLIAFLHSAPSNDALLTLAAQPADSVLEGEELADFRRVGALRTDPNGPEGPAHLGLILKATRLCNLRCTYCGSRREGSGQAMETAVLLRAIHGALTTPGVRSLELVWHGGEPTLRPLDFYRKALWLQQQFRRPGQRIVNNLQTNGTRLGEEWLDFLQTYDFRVGVSLDGPPEIHDRRRRDAVDRPTSDRIRAGLVQLRERRIPHGICMVVDREVVDAGPARILEYLLEIGVDWVGLLRVVPQGTVVSRLGLDVYVDFLRRLFLLWWPRYRDRLSIREIDDLTKRLQGRRGNYCYFQEECLGSFLTIEPDGEVSACDKFQGLADYRFGHLGREPMQQIFASPRLATVRRSARPTHDRHACRWSELCQGGCAHDRHLGDTDAGPEDRCCGWGPLITTISEVLGEDPDPSSVP